MPRFARIFFISLVSAAGSCSGEQLAQKQVENKRPPSATGHGLQGLCTHLVRVAASNNGRSQYGISQAFTVCQTEEKKLQDVSDGAIPAYRNTLKEELLRR